ncbi:hypothetical protein O181_051160 [Austropuccinia psidii MF-1]|uniref:Uncharacterized protein n=1 Tax=Austropuccinia psidii MF-1 TaxID=1389203 RepID=A0A9Q3E2H7_9BASI|nr:hypothetical protein [Austropuccinia psidii MF-1]
MTPTRNGSRYSIQSNGSGPGHSSNKSKGQDCQPRVEAPIEDARASTSSQRLAITFDTLIESREAEITAIPVVRTEPFPTGKKRNISVAIQKLVYDGKEAGVGTSAKSLDRHNELISSSEEVHEPRKDRGYSEGLNTHVFQKTNSTDKSLVEKPKHVIREPEEDIGLKKVNSAVEAPQVSTSKNSPQQVPNKGRKTPKHNHKGKQKKKESHSPSATSLTHRTTELPRKRRMPWTMWSIWQEL